jgi:CheY-like chemotaxis protein
MVSIFVEQGFAPVYAAENGGEALSILREKVVDGMILDIRMPGLSGIDILCSMREQNLAEPLIFILSGYDDFAYAQAAIPYGVAEYILKPLVPERAVEFCRKMKALIEDRKRMREEHTFLERSVREKEWAVRKRDIERILAGRDSEGFSAVLSGYGFLPPYDRSYALLAARIDDSSGGAFFLGLGEELSAAFPRSIRGRVNSFTRSFSQRRKTAKSSRSSSASWDFRRQTASPVLISSNGWKGAAGERDCFPAGICRSCLAFPIRDESCARCSSAWREEERREIIL